MVRKAREGISGRGQGRVKVEPSLVEQMKNHEQDYREEVGGGFEIHRLLFST
jgi:hypothetical protein